jgi:hypothetical protein
LMRMEVVVHAAPRPNGASPSRSEQPPASSALS